ncbi:glycine zipper domain-containing protein [Variovorax sp. J22R24]|uniref:glycine zipper domain-containing protein n=1 Tax=Variovorax gracilis TaxID=3053502 RepID=UPI0025766FAC|nr:glycine zipper domain-containing protein [Variovorax sp. J22R24]MDM0107817.1 glycine zipper domain-containing protein [Variovorax sp. J22R24]
MKTRLWISAASAACVLTLAGCASGPNQNLGTAGGAVGGALIGNAVGGNTASTVGGAAIGGLIGNQVGRSVDERNQRNYYPSNSYYPNNGPRY